MFVASNDLVYENNRWMTLLDSSEFGEAALVPHRRLMRRKHLKLGVTIVVVAILAAAGLAAMTQLGDLMRWLIRDDC